MHSKLNTTTIVVIAFLMALEIILTRFLSIQLPIVRLGFGFLPVALMGILYGPLWAGATYALGDILGMLIFPSPFPYFPGFTLTALLVGIVYGLVLHNNQITWKRTLLATSIVCILLNLGLDTLWLYLTMDKAVVALMPARLLKCAIMLPVQTILIYTLWNKYLNKVSFLQKQ